MHSSMCSEQLLLEVLDHLTVAQCLTNQLNLVTRLMHLGILVGNFKQNSRYLRCLTEESIRLEGEYESKKY